MNKLTEWMVKPFIKEEFGAPPGFLPSPSQKQIKKVKKRLDRSVYSEIDENLDEAKQKLKLNIPADIKKIHKLFKKNRKQLYVVGGAVRDAILGNTPKDFDLVTDAKPDDVLKIAKQGGFKTVEVGKSFGVVVVNGHEIATFRKDIGKGRRPDAVDFTDIKGDVKRRDLTINALFYDIDKQDIVDLVGGIKDLKKKQIRTVGLADARFDEDPLRKLRAVRFSSTIGGRIHSDTLSALKKNPSLRGVSAERIRDEFVKSLSKAKSPSKYLKLVHNLKMLQQILPGLNINKKFINSKDYIVQLSYLLKDNDSSKLGNKLNSLRYTTKESTNVLFLVSLQNFKSEEIYTYKKFQEKTSLTMAQIKEYGKLIGNEKDVVKMAKFKLSIKSKDVSKDLKGAEIGKAIKTKEKEKFLNEIAVRKKPKTFRDIYNALPSDLKKRVMNLKNYQQRKDAHPEGNVLKHTIAVTNRALRTGDIDFALSALFHDIGKDSTAKLHPKKGFWTHYGHEHVSAKLVKKHDKWIKSMGGNTLDIYWIVKQHMRMKVFDKMKWQKQDKMKKFRAFDKLKKFSKDFDKGGRGMSDSKIIEKKLDSYMESFVYSVSEIEEDLPKIKKVVGIYGGRFQPFGPHHKKTYEWLKKQVDDVYITTSNIKQPPRHPLNFTEKVRHMVKMGIPKNRIIEERTPYVAKNVLKKYDKDTTAVIYIFGAKDAGRLKGGKYFQDYKKNKNNMSGYEKNGYVLTAPHVSIKVGGKEVSGTVMRDLLGSPQYKKNREKLFRQAFGYFDKNIFNMMNSRFKKLYEFIDNNLDKIKDIIKESSVMAGSPVDDGPPTFHISFNDYKTSSKEWLEKNFEGLGWQVMNYMISKNAQDPLLDFSIRLNTVPAIAYGNLHTPKSVAIAKYKKNIENRVLNNVGFEIIKWFGLKDDFSETTGVDVAQPVLPGKHNAEKNTDLKESFDLDDEVKFLLEVDGMLLEEGVKFNNFLKDWSKKGKQPLDKVRKTMMNKNTFSIAKLNDFSVDKVLDSAKKGFKTYQKVMNYVPDKIAKKLAKTKFGEKKEKGLKKLDNYLQKNPKLKRVMGVAAAAGVTYAWTKMTFIGDPEYDLDLSAAATAAAVGDYSMSDLFSGEMGTKFLVLTAVGAATGLTAPYTKILGSVGTMAAGVSFGAYKAYKAHKQKKADVKKKTSAPDTVKNPNPRGRKKTIGRQSAVRWVAKNKGSKAAQKYNKSLSETKLFTPDWWKENLFSEDDIVKNKKSGNTYIVQKHNSDTQNIVKKNASDKEIEKVKDNKKSSSSKERMKTIKSWGKDPHGNLFLGDDKVGYSAKIHKAQYVTKTKNSMVIGTPHTEHDKKGKQFFKKNITPMVKDFIEEHGAENVVFLAEGGQGDGHNYYPNTEQEAVGKMVGKAGGSVDTWDGKYNKHDDGHEKAPIYKDLAKKMGKQYTPSQMTGAMYSNLVGQGDDGKEAMDSYLTEDGKQFLKDNGYKGEFPPKDKSEVQQLYDLNYPEDSGEEPGSNPVAKAQLAWNQARRDNMARKIEELEKQGKKVLVVPGATHGSAIKAQSKKSKKEIKEQIDIIDETKELLLMGGAAGHMSHPFDDNHLTFGDFKNIIDMSLEGKLSREDNVTEKLDGQNLMVSYVDGELRGARNKGHLKMFGKTSLNINGMKSLFSGRGDIEKAFVGSMKDLSKSIGSLSDKQKEKVFGNGSKWMNLEIMYPATANVIDYDVSELFFHGSIEIDESGQTISQITDSARMLEGMIRQMNANIQKRFKISKPVVLNLPKVQDFSKKKKYFLSKLRKLQTIYRLKDNNTLGMHNEMYWREYIFNGAKQHKYKISRIVLESLVKRWAYIDKSFRLDKKNIKHDKFLSWAKGVDKFDHKKLAYEHIKPFELLFLELGAEILKNLDGFLAVNPKKAVQKMKKELKTAISGLRTSKDIKKIDLLKKNLQKINSIGGTSSIVPSEGLVFKYKGNMYKFTGAFAPVNQILGALKFSR